MTTARNDLESAAVSGCRSCRRGHRSAALRVLAVLGLCAGIAAARTGTVTGRVHDPEQGVPVEYANVVLRDAGDSSLVTGAATDASGEFELADVQAGSYYLEVSFIGFASRRVGDVVVAPGARLDVGRLDLVARPLPVEGAEAVAERPAVRYEVDKRVIEVSALPMAAAGTAVDALENAPSVTVDIEGNVSLRGSRNFRVLVDGKPTMFEPSEALRQIPAGAIDRIEIITNPSAMYDPDGTSGIINVIMKRRQHTGWSALSNLNAGQSSTGGADLLLGYRQGIVNAHAGGDLHRRAYLHTTETWRETRSGADTSRFSGTTDNSWQGRIGGGRGGLELQPGERDRVGLSGMYRQFNTDNRSEGRELWPGTPGAGPGFEYTSRSAVRAAGRFGYLSADYRRDLDTSGQTFAAEAWLGRRDWATDDSSELADTVTLSGRLQQTEASAVWSRFKTEYTLPRREDDRFEAGYQARYEQVSDDSRHETYSRVASGLEPDSVPVHIVNGRRLVHALYGSYSWNRQPLGFKAGLRGEYGTRTVSLDRTGETWELQRWDAFPTAHLAFGLPAGQQLTTSYSRRIERPHPWNLQPYETRTGATSVYTGNPDLLPELTDSWEAGYQVPLSAGMVAAEVYWRSTANPIQHIVEPPDPERPGITRTSVANVGNARSAGGQLTLNLRPVRFWGITLTGNLYDYRLEGELNAAPLSRRSFAQTGQFSTDLTLPLGQSPTGFMQQSQTRLQLTGFFSSPNATAQGRHESYFVTSAALRQSFLNRSLTVTLRVRDLLDTARWETSSEGPGFSNRSKSVGEPRVFSLTLSWNFNNFRLDPRMREPEGMDIPTGPQS